MWCEVWPSLHSFALGVSAVSAPVVEKTILFLLESSGCPCRDRLAVGANVYFWTLDAVPLTRLSVLRPVPRCLDLCSSAVSLNRACDSNSFLLLKIVSAILGPLHPHKNVRIRL